MTDHKSLFALALALVAGPSLAEDYLGTLKPPQSSLTPPGIYSFSSVTPSAAASPAGESAYRLKLGYKYSRYFAVEGEYVDFKPAGPELFASPGHLASAFRSTGFGVDTIAMLPLWRFSLYGRLGAYRGDARSGFGYGSTALLPAEGLARGTRWRYGMGMRYDFTKSLGIRAELERNAPLGSPLATEAEAADQFSVGVSWRF